MTLNKYKNVKIMAVVILIVGLILASGAYTWSIFLKNNSDKVFLNSIFSEYKNVKGKGNMSESYIKQKGSALLSGEFTTGSENEVKTKLDNVNISWDSSADTKKVESITNFLVEIGNKKYLNTDLVLSNNSIYINLKDTFDKYIEIANFTDKNSKKIYTDKEVQMLTNHFTAVLKNSLKKEYFVFEKQEIKEGERTLKANTVSIKLDNKRVKDISINVVQNIKDDGYIVEELAKVNGITKLEQLEKIEKNIQDMKNSNLIENKEEATISVSVDFFGNLKQLKIETSNKLEGTYKKYSGIKEYLLTDNNKSSLNIKSFKSKGQIVSSIVGNFENMYLSGEIKSKKIDSYSNSAEYSIFTKEKETDTIKQFEINGEFTSVDKQLTKFNKEGESKFDIDMNLELKGKKVGAIKFIYDNKKEGAKTYVAPTLSKVVKYEDLTELDYEKIMKSEPFKSMSENQEIITGFVNGFVMASQNNIANKAKFAKLKNDMSSTEETIQYKIAEYMASSKGAQPIIITEGTAKSGELKIDLPEESKKFTISSSGTATYKPNMTVAEFIKEYGLTSESEIPVWVVLKK